MHATWVLKLRAISTRCFDSQSFLNSSVPELDLFFLQPSVSNVVSSFEYFESFRLTLRSFFSSFGSSVVIHRMICVEKRTQKKFSEFQMGIEPTTF